MTQNIVTFIGRDLKHLVESNMDAEGKTSKFWLQPCDEGEPDYQALVEEGVEYFNTTTLEKELNIDGIKISTIRCKGNDILAAYTLENMSGGIDPSLFGLQYATPHFIQLAKFAVKAQIQFSKPIPVRVANERIYEEDLLTYFPPLIFLTILPDLDDESLLVSYMRVVLFIEQDKIFVEQLRENLIELALSLPDQDHEWLFHQLYSVVRSRKIENIFLGLYRLLEFFFPLQNVLDLRAKISFTDSNLSLVRHCIDTLNWHIGHHNGAKSSINFAGVNFAEVCLDQSFVYQVDGKPRNVQEDNFKKKAMDELSKIRHDLTHQNFSFTTYNFDMMIRYSEALICYLTDAFKAYRAYSAPSPQSSGASPANPAN